MQGDAIPEREIHVCLCKRGGGRVLLTEILLPRIARQGTVCLSSIRGQARTTRIETIELDEGFQPYHPPFPTSSTSVVQPNNAYHIIMPMPYCTTWCNSTPRRAHVTPYNPQPLCTVYACSICLSTYDKPTLLRRPSACSNSVHALNVLLHAFAQQHTHTLLHVWSRCVLRVA